MKDDFQLELDDKGDYKRGNRNCNAYRAESVWKSIHNPITRELISSEDKEIKYESDEVYYKQKTTTKSLRDFHNKFVKIVNKNSSIPTKNDIDRYVSRKRRRYVEMV